MLLPLLPLKMVSGSSRWSPCPWRRWRRDWCLFGEAVLGGNENKEEEEIEDVVCMVEKGS